MARLWECTDVKMTDRPPVCVIACAWYPPIQVRALVYPDTTVNDFLCSLHLPDVLYRVLTGNRPTRIYIGNECRIVDGYGEHRSSKTPPRHVTVSLRLVTQKGKCILLCPDQPLDLRSNALVELVCCETTVSTTTRDIRFPLADRTLSDNEERAFVELQSANHQWLWSKALEPPLALTQPPREDLPPLPPWKRNKFEWVETLKRHRDSKMMGSIGNISSNEGYATSTRNGVRKQPLVAKRQRTVESSTRDESTERQVNESTEPEDLDEPHVAVPDTQTNGAESTPNKSTDHQAQVECDSRVGGTNADEDTPVHDGLGSPLGKAVSELDVILESFKGASPDDMGSPLKKAISRLAGNIETLKSASQNDSNGLEDAISHLGDNIEHLRELTNSISKNPADKDRDRREQGNDSCVTNLALQSGEVDLVSHSYDNSNATTENELQTPSRENQNSREGPPSIGDSTDEDSCGKKIMQHITAKGDEPVIPKGPILVPHQPAVQEPELTKVWSDVDDDDGLITLPNDNSEDSLGDTSSTSSSSSNSSSSSSTSSSESSSDSDSDSMASSDEAEDSNNAKISSDQDTTKKDNLKTNSKTTSNGTLEFSKQSIEMNGLISNKSSEPCPPCSSQGTHSPLAKTEFDKTTAMVGKDASTQHDLILTTELMECGEHETPKSDKSDNDISGSSSESDSDSSSSSSDSESSSVAQDEDMVLETITEISKTSVTTKAIAVAESMQDYRTPPNHDGLRPTTTSGNKRRRRPLLSSKKKIII